MKFDAEIEAANAALKSVAGAAIAAAEKASDAFQIAIKVAEFDSGELDRNDIDKHHDAQIELRIIEKFGVAVHSATVDAAVARLQHIQQRALDKILTAGPMRKPEQ